jgi:hypothetical protein
LAAFLHGELVDAEAIEERATLAADRMPAGYLGRFRISADETLDIGEDTGTPVSEDYQVPFKFTGDLKKVTIQLKDAVLSTEDQVEMEQMKAVLGVSE